jgi:hypothetical protein
MKIPYENRIVAFIDILGFASLVSRLSLEPDLHEQLYSALAQFKSFKAASMKDNTAYTGLEMSVFSDSIVISGNESELYSVAYACSWLQAQLLGRSVLVRGGISWGNTCHQDEFLYGEGMLKAYRIESTAAVYPRIVIDPNLINPTSDWICQVLLLKDLDGLWRIDPFAIKGYLPREETRFEDGDDELQVDEEDSHQLYLEEVGKLIDENIRSVQEVNRLAKWTWLKAQYDMADRDYRETRETRFWKNGPLVRANYRGRIGLPSKRKDT